VLFPFRGGSQRGGRDRISRKKNEATAFKEEMLKAAEGHNITNCESADIQFYEDYVEMCFILGSARVLFKNQQNKHYGHI